MEQLMNKQAVARLLGVSLRTVERLWPGQIKTMEVGRQVRFRPEDMTLVLEMSAQVPAPTPGRNCHFRLGFSKRLHRRRRQRSPARRTVPQSGVIIAIIPTAPFGKQISPANTSTGMWQRHPRS